VKVYLPADLKDVVGPRTAAMKYVEEVRAGLVTTLAPEVLHEINDKYRRALVADANIERRREGYKPLDPSPVQLAHPRLDLYVDADSKHDMNAVGCTSCHDGSGQETDFVVAAHSPRPIWVDQKTGEPVLPG